MEELLKRLLAGREWCRGQFYLLVVVWRAKNQGGLVFEHGS